MAHFHVLNYYYYNINNNNSNNSNKYKTKKKKKASVIKGKSKKGKKEKKLEELTEKQVYLTTYGICFSPISSAPEYHRLGLLAQMGVGTVLSVGTLM